MCGGRAVADSTIRTKIRRRRSEPNRRPRLCRLRKPPYLRQDPLITPSLPHQHYTQYTAKFRIAARLRNQPTGPDVAMPGFSIHSRCPFSSVCLLYPKPLLDRCDDRCRVARAGRGRNAARRSDPGLPGERCEAASQIEPGVEMGVEFHGSVVAVAKHTPCQARKLRASR